MRIAKAHGHVSPSWCRLYLQVPYPGSSRGSRATSCDSASTSMLSVPTQRLYATLEGLETLPCTEGPLQQPAKHCRPRVLLVLHLTRSGDVPSLLTDASKLFTRALIFLSPLRLGFSGTALVAILMFKVLKGGNFLFSWKGPPGWGGMTRSRIIIITLIREVMAEA